MLLNDTWSQWGHSVSCTTILFLNLQIIKSDIRPHIKWAVSLVLAYGDFYIPLGFMWVCMGWHTHVLPLRGQYVCCSIWWCGWGCLHGYALINMSWNYLECLPSQVGKQGRGSLQISDSVHRCLQHHLWGATSTWWKTSYLLSNDLKSCMWFPQNTSLSLPGPRLQFQRFVHPAKQNRHYYKVTDGSVVNTDISGTWKFVVNTLVS